MRMVIAGGGKVGLNLAIAMIGKRHQVSLIESDREKCSKLANILDAEIVHGDCTNVSTLEAAKTKDADCVMVVTGSDQENIVAAQLAKNYFNAKKVIARTSDPRNLETFRVLGIDYAVSSTDIITRLIEQEADLSSMHLLASLSKGKGVICTKVLREDTIFNGVALKHMKFPSGALIISIVRNDELIIPNGDTTLRIGDEVVAVCQEKARKALNKVLESKNRKQN